jgi:hypothetical protein
VAALAFCAAATSAIKPSTIHNTLQHVGNCRIDPDQDASSANKVLGNGDFGHLKRDIAALADDLRPELETDGVGGERTA